jgi:hypothetical protein
MRVHQISALAPHVRRLASKGWTADAILRVYPRLTRADVRAILAPPPAKPARPPRPAKPARLRPSSWSGEWWLGSAYRDDDDAFDLARWERLKARILELLAAAGPPSPVPPILALPAPCGDWGSMHGSKDTGNRSNNAKLSDDDAARVRQLHAEGFTRRELSEAFGLSMASIGKILSGRTYRDAELAPEPEPAPPPAIAAPPPTGSTWSEPASPGRAWRDD